MHKRVISRLLAGLMIFCMAVTGTPYGLLSVRADGEETGTVGEDQTECEEGIEGIVIDEVHFPDEAFRTYVSQNFDKNSDNELSADELKNVETVDVAGQDWSNMGVVSSLAGIEYFPELCSVNCNYNCMNSLDVSNNPKLATLDCLGCGLKELKTGNNGSLKEIMLIGNNLKSIDLSKCDELESLKIDGNQIDSLDVSNCPKLSMFSCGSTGLTSLDVSGNPELTRLTCEGNQLTALSLENNPKLNYLKCDGNKIAQMDVCECVNLATLICDNNALQALDISHCPKMTYLTCSQNAITELNLKNNTMLSQTECWKNPISQMDIRGNQKLTDLVRKGTRSLFSGDTMARYEYEDAIFVLNADVELLTEEEPGTLDEVESFLLDTEIMDGDPNGVPYGTILVEGNSLEMVTDPQREDADQVTFKVIPDEYQELYGLEICWMIGDDIQGDGFALSEENAYTVYKKDAWQDYSVDLLTEKVPLNDQYYVDPRDKETLGFTDGRQVRTNYEFTVGTPIEFDLEENVYKAIVKPAFGESEEIDVNGSHFSYTPQTRQGLWIDVYTSQGQYDYDFFTADDDSKEYVLRYSVHKDGSQGGTGGNGSVSLDKDPIRAVTLADDTKVLYDRDNAKQVSITIKPDAGSTYIIKESDKDVTSSVKANGDVYVWDASSADWDGEIPKIDIEFIVKADGSEPSVIPNKKGDINGDTNVNRADRIYLARALADWEGYDVPGTEMADFNGDGIVNRADRIYLARALAEWDGYVIE